MSTRSRQTNRPDAAPPDVYDDEFGLVTDADIAAYLADEDAAQEAETKQDAGFLNVQTASGLGLIALGALYALQQTGLVPFVPDLSRMLELLPVLASVLIMLTGFGVLSWSPAARRRRKARERAATMQRQARKTMGRDAERAERRDAAVDAAVGVATAAARGAVGAATRAFDAAGRAGARAAEVAGAEQQARRRGAATRSGSFRFAKDRRNRKITGVAAGIARATGLDPTVVRIAFVALAALTQGGGIALYILLSFLMPAEPRGDAREDSDDDPFVRVSRD